ncbi:MAG: class I SAM-dependent methyltransferase [Cohaesibacter sp.]|jgi:SAM-dependent methyltransferase|nr:class I SAM-dependent methyltransferase [Cohaesibacter sp.]
MFLDVVDLRNFYAQPLGRTVARFINEKIADQWPNLKGLSVLGLGYTPPYLRAMRASADRTLAFMPATQGAVYWPSTGSCLTSLVDYDRLPLPDACMDRIILTHMLELVDNPADQLREIWRVLTPGGRLLIVVPNRRGVWARMEQTPFGYGRPFSRGQLTHLLRDTLFTPVAWNEALYFGPFKGKTPFGSARAWEKVGARFWPAFSGVLIVEVTKLLHQGLVTKETRKLSQGLRPIFLPAPNVPFNLEAAEREEDRA